jgi:Flp pilus assembly protein CpaB
VPPAFQVAHGFTLRKFRVDAVDQGHGHGGQGDGVAARVARLVELDVFGDREAALGQLAGEMGQWELAILFGVWPN